MTDLLIAFLSGYAGFCTVALGSHLVSLCYQRLRTGQWPPSYSALLIHNNLLEFQHKDSIQKVLELKTLLSQTEINHQLRTRTLEQKNSDLEAELTAIMTKIIDRSIN